MSVLCSGFLVCWFSILGDHIHRSFRDPHERKHNASVGYEFAHILAGGTFFPEERARTILVGVVKGFDQRWGVVWGGANLSCNTHVG